MRCVGADRIFGFGRRNHSVVCRSLKEAGRLSWRPLSSFTMMQEASASWLVASCLFCLWHPVYFLVELCFCDFHRPSQTSLDPIFRIKTTTGQKLVLINDF